MPTQIVIIGGVAGGATAAARARRLDENAQITVFERGRDVSFANCGLPYHIGGEIRRRAALLVQTREGLAARFNLDIRTRTEVTSIDRATRTVTARDLETGQVFQRQYDFLLLSPGAAPIVPPLPGVQHPAVFTLRNLDDMDRIKDAVQRDARAAVVVGGGFIGVEMAENLKRRELTVHLVELLPQVMPPLDPEVAERLHRELRAHGVHVHLSEAVTAFADDAGAVRVALRSGAELRADFAVLSVGVRPESDLARAAGLELSERGAIVVDEHMRTSDPRIYAVGDAVQVRDMLLNEATVLPLAGPANRQARVAVDHMFGLPGRYAGAQGTSIVRVFNVTAASTGLSEKVLQRRGVPFRKIYVHRGQHVGYFPGAQSMMIKLLFAPDDGRILGAQIVGADGVDKRIDVLATAQRAGLTVTDLEDLELAYAPQYGAAKDPVNIAGYVATNMLRGHEEYVYAEQLNGNALSEWTLLDVRQPEEFAAGHLPGARNIPLSELRQRWRELPTELPIAVYCNVGQRSYYASRVLRQYGLKLHNIAGGLDTFNLVHPQ